MNPGSDDPFAFWVALSEKLRPRSHPTGGLRIGKQGVYLIDCGDEVTSFKLIPWQQVLLDFKASNLNPGS